MEGRTLTFLFLSGLCFLPVCFPRRYILVREALTWTEAQSYCREKFTDLASVSSQQESDQLREATEELDVGHLWIGLYNDIDSWRWSLEEEGYYGEGEAEFRKWGVREPNNFMGIEHCAMMHISGVWIDVSCNIKIWFTCFKNSSSSFILVNETKTWTEAQRYCRERYTDLASVRNQSENDQIMKNMKNMKKYCTWIGLNRDSWKWSDGSPYSFTSWNISKQIGPVVPPCVLLHKGLWHSCRCDAKLFFLCHFEPVKPQRVLRVKVILKDSTVNLEEAADAILLQFRERLKEHGLREDVKLTWRKQPDGKIFNLEKREKKKKKKKKKEEEEEQFICS
ncbi:secretory phospholipase A2 receptor-like [Labrus mixtus]|uniref:secretory phospholipase A2 receptor-like n=1 Tax=Labrus mixtus TaxID=508554 RepID=UPI0029C0BB66|nr:secretory phospholipase A2 receptor-like [Labrus mixtus]